MFSILIVVQDYFVILFFSWIWVIDRNFTTIKLWFHDTSNCQLKFVTVVFCHGIPYKGVSTSITVF